MQKITSQCANCGAFTRRSVHHEEEYQTSVLLERLRATNFPPTDEEISHVRHTILPTVSDDISSIESKLASLRGVITSMEEERERLKNVQKRYSNLVSLHRTLPLEILSEIFLYTLPGDSDSNAFDASGSIWQLSHVCQRWRNVALSLHSFWSTMDINFPQAAQHEGDVQRLEAVIQRSRQGLLDVSLSDDPSDPQTSNPSILKRILDIVLAESYRWRVLHLTDWGGDLNMLYASLHNRLPRLEAVGLYCPPLELDEHSTVSVFKDCPRLTKLTLGGSMPGVEFPWDQITELDLSYMGSDGDEEAHRACMRLIGQCPSLETLSTPYWDSEDDDDSTYTPITCSNVRKLDATSVPVALTLPLLREASFRPEPSTAHYNHLYSFKQLLIRSNCLSALTSLSLASVPLAASMHHTVTLHSLLSQTHSLASFKLAISLQDYNDQTDVSDREQIVTILKSLEVIPAKTVTFLPLLSSLDIRVYNHRNSYFLLCFGPVGSLASMVKARWKGDDTVGLARLRTCHFAVQAHHLRDGIYRDVTTTPTFVPHIFSEAERLIFDALVDDGMDLAIRVTSALTQSVGSNSVIFAV
ncbi:hypothetical protein BDZ89DRAFT_1067817 [Hymenopellis radicata]|nr:hypothetical protein BDZ89DRAFT_1067817 [Hymenopellis radicata]